VLKEKTRKKMSDKFWKDRNVFVTGCTGLLGSWLTKALVERGANVVGLIRDLVPKSNLNWSGFNDKISIVRGEIEDYFLLERAINEYEIDTVFHLAAQTIVTIANRNPISTFETNMGGTWNVLEACRRAPLVKRILVASSDKAYGDQEKLPYDENTPLDGRHPYDVSKSCADLVCRAYFETYELPVCVTRCGNFYGGGDLNFNRIVPGTIRSVLNNEPPVIRSDGTLVRDYFYIEDAVEAYLLLAEKMENKEIYGKAFNFSNELQITVLEMVEKIIAVMDSNLKPVILNEATNEIKHQYLSAKKAKEILGWKSRYTLEEGLSRTIKWYRKFFAEEENKQ
jgi:CDP-glucose 4,6-dehydratase